MQENTTNNNSQRGGVRTGITGAGVVIGFRISKSRNSIRSKSSSSISRSIRINRRSKRKFRRRRKNFLKTKTKVYILRRSTITFLKKETFQSKKTAINSNKIIVILPLLFAGRQTPP